MGGIARIGTYLPPWLQQGRRVKGPDEDALTMAVAAGRAADPANSAQRVVFVSREFPLLEGGNGAVLLAGLSLAADIPVAEVLGGAPAVIDQILSAGDRTLIVAADDSGGAVGAAAVLMGRTGATLTELGRQTRSLPMQARGIDGVRHTYIDPRLQREVGLRQTLTRLELASVPVLAAVAGSNAQYLNRDFDASAAIGDPITSAAAAIRVIADAITARNAGVVLAVEQSSISLAELGGEGHEPTIVRDEDCRGELPPFQIAKGSGIPISLPAYVRAFEPKLRWQAAVFDERPGISSTPVFPPRTRVDDFGRLVNEYRCEPLPRTGTVYTHTTIRFPVPDLASPYSLAVVQLDDSPVRVLMKVTGISPGEIAIGDQGVVVLRRIATRAGIPDYGYAFWPHKRTPRKAST